MLPGQLFSTDRVLYLLTAAIVTAGALVGYLVHPTLYLLSITVGIALVVIGMADATGMGLFLARLPSLAELPVAARRLARGRF